MSCGLAPPPTRVLALFSSRPQPFDMTSRDMAWHNTPRHATSLHSAPRHSTPRHATPRHDSILRAGPCLSPVPKQTGGEPDLPSLHVKSRVSAISDVPRCLWWALEPNQRGGRGGSGRQAQRAPLPGVAVGRRPSTARMTPKWPQGMGGGGGGCH